LYQTNTLIKSLKIPKA